ncbi:C40 family peptidase [Mechercharimyces sp. CAU 1602]|uniref:C40 family peptidase n=1 Tax=Mechercharimyces sp. CAU 1602 TaxID=2973933 RepID=UPI002162D795|nr:C40 family peptidase [Mechercharimyces sp. CAU 1602]MCS1352176.1 NlpC/P60 family protein [Mechercharimyces sp. CAU 1602]
MRKKVGMMTGAAVACSMALPQVVDASEQLHTVAKNETLYGIASKYNLSVEELMEQNQKETTLIFPGDQLFIAAGTNEGEQAKSALDQEKNTIWKLAREHHFSLNHLLEMNPHMESVNLIYVGHAVNLIPKPKADPVDSVNQKEGTTLASSTSAKQVEDKKSSTPSISKEKKDGKSDTGEWQTKAQQLVSFAKGYIGVPYRYGANGPSAFDCSGFTQYVYREFGISLPRSSSQQKSVGSYVARDQLRVGDLLYFGKGISHVGIYIGDGKMISAENYGTNVRIASVASGYWADHYVSGRRLIQ